MQKDIKEKKGKERKGKEKKRIGILYNAWKFTMDLYNYNET